MGPGDRERLRPEEPKRCDVGENENKTSKKFWSLQVGSGEEPGDTEVPGKSGGRGPSRKGNIVKRYPRGETKLSGLPSGKVEGPFFQLRSREYHSAGSRERRVITCYQDGPGESSKSIAHISLMAWGEGGSQGDY